MEWDDGDKIRQIWPDTDLVKSLVVTLLGRNHLGLVLTVRPIGMQTAFTQAGTARVTTLYDKFTPKFAQILPVLEGDGTGIFESPLFGG